MLNGWLTWNIFIEWLKNLLEWKNTLILCVLKKSEKKRIVSVFLRIITLRYKVEKYVTDYQYPRNFRYVYFKLQLFAFSFKIKGKSTFYTKKEKFLKFFTLKCRSLGTHINGNQILSTREIKFHSFSDYVENYVGLNNRITFKLAKLGVVYVIY